MRNEISLRTGICLSDLNPTIIRDDPVFCCRSGVRWEKLFAKMAPVLKPINLPRIHRACWKRARNRSSRLRSHSMDLSRRFLTVLSSGWSICGPSVLKCAVAAGRLSLRASNLKPQTSHLQTPLSISSCMNRPPCTVRFWKPRCLAESVKYQSVSGTRESLSW